MKNNRRALRIQYHVETEINNKITGLKNNGKSSHCAFITSKDCKTILSRGSNHDKSNNIGTEHAEVNALRNFSSNVRKVSVTVLKYTKTGKLGNSMPCIRCQHTLLSTFKDQGVNLVDFWYSTSDGTIAQAKPNTLDAYVCKKDRQSQNIISRLNNRISDVRGECTLVDEMGNPICSCTETCEEESEDDPEKQQFFYHLK
tara:strand:+ start:17731 stop:18330 length:600 start_codon:yes stop_codon:yes gene_type:complete